MRQVDKEILFNYFNFQHIISRHSRASSVKFLTSQFPDQKIPFTFDFPDCANLHHYSTIDPTERSELDVKSTCIKSLYSQY